MLGIERSSVLVDQLPLPVDNLDELKKEAKETTVLLSTRMEDNDLDEEIKRKSLYKTSDYDKEQEVYNLMNATEFLDESEARELTAGERTIREKVKRWMMMVS